MTTREGIGRDAWKGTSAAQWSDWRWQCRHRVRSVRQLALLLGRPPEAFASLEPVLAVYPLAITPYYLSLMNPFSESDPLRRQCFPDLRELTTSPGEEADPLAEEAAMPVPGLIHRYPDRCLAIAAGFCAVNCRHCNRKRLWRAEPEGDAWGRLQPMVDYVARTPALREVIVSGGDPLMLSDRLLDRFLGALRAIPHLEILRIGSRVPVTLPMRVTPGLCTILKRHRPLWFNTQFNHPREITPESAAACDRLLLAGIPVSNQSVLLKGVNDDEGTMGDLLQGLQRISVRPYYLFNMDPVAGGSHFRVEIWRGMAVMERLWRSISGLCLPRYVMDCPGGRGKIPLQPFSLLPEKGDGDKLFDKPC